MPPQQNTAPATPPLQSFRPYTGKAPVIIQIVGGLLWLSAAGLIVYGVLGLLLNPINGVIFLVLAAVIIITGKSLFSMKKTAFRNTIVTVVLILASVAYSSFSTSSFNYTSLVTPALLLLIAFYYRNRFVN